MKNRKLRVGMVGAGGISRTHCEGWKKLDEAELVAITDIDEGAAKARAEQYGIEAVETDAKKVFARDDIDAVDIVVPNTFHKDYTVAALKAGKHVLCEKPLALTPREVDAMIAASEKSGRKLMCAQHQRFAAQHAALKEYLETHPIGDIYFARAWMHRRRLMPGRAGFIYKSNSGGGACIDIGVHVLDLVLWLMDKWAPVSVSGVSLCKLSKRPDSWSEWGGADYDRKGFDVEDFAAGFVRFADGSALNLEVSWMLNMKPRSDQRIELYGTEGGAALPAAEVYTHTSRGYVNTTVEALDTKEKAHHAEIRAFAECVLKDEPVPVPPRQSRVVMAILDGLYRSQETGKEVRLTDKRKQPRRIEIRGARG